MITIALTPSAPSLQTASFVANPCHSNTIKLFLLFNTTEVSYLSQQVSAWCSVDIFSFVPAVLADSCKVATPVDSSKLLIMAKAK